MTDHKQALAAAAHAKEAAAEAFDDAIRAAFADGVAKADIARWAGITRPTVDRVLGDSLRLPPRRDWPGVLDDALLLLIEAGGSDSTMLKDAATGLRVSDLTIKARRLGWAAKNASGLAKLTVQQRQTLGAGQDLAAHIMRGRT